ncbi:MAG: GntR family transcriptional regulator [Bacilli bacterium]
MHKYQELANIIKERINNNYYDEKKNLPVEVDLCQEFNVSKITVKRAIDVLVKEGLVIKKQGSGNYINNMKDHPLFNKYEVKNVGFATAHKGLNYVTKLEKFKIIKANATIAKYLQVDEDDDVYEIYRVRMIDNRPSRYEHTFLPVSLIPHLTKEQTLISVYQHISDNLNLKIDSSHDFYFAEKANDLDCLLLDINEDDPVPVLEQLAFLDSGQPFMYSITRFYYKDYFHKSITRFD